MAVCDVRGIGPVVTAVPKRVAGRSARAGAALPLPRRRERAGRVEAHSGSEASWVWGPRPWEGWIPTSRWATAASSLRVAELPSTLALVLEGMEDGRALEGSL